jgi:hypothetical protein
VLLCGKEIHRKLRGLHACARRKRGIKLCAMFMKLVLVAVFLLCSACGSIIIGSEGWYQNRQNAKAMLEKQASFDLSCDVGEIQVTPLGQGSAPYLTVGVSGCGKKVKYIWLAERQQWVANTAQN